MRTARFITLAATAALLASCNGIQPEAIGPKLITREFTASYGSETRTEMDGLKVLWCTSGESIDIIDDNGDAYTLGLKELGSDRHFANFEGQVPETGCKYAVYPSGTCTSYDDGAITITLPTTQKATVDGFATRTNPCVAVVTDGDMLEFRNVCALVGITVNASGISSVRLSGTESSGGDMSGPCLLEFSDGLPVSVTDASTGKDYVELTGGLASGKQYWALVHPGTYSNLKVVFTDSKGRTATFTKDGEIVLGRSKARRIAAFTITDSDWDSQEESGTATLTFDECSGAFSTYDEPGSYTNEYGTWTISAYKSNAIQLNSPTSKRKRVYICTPEFPAPIRTVTVSRNSNLDRTGAVYLCTEPTNGSIPTPNVSKTMGKNAESITLDASTLNARQVYICTDFMLSVSQVTVNWGGSVTPPPAPVPTVTTLPAGNIGVSQATLNASFSGIPTSPDPTAAFFRWGKSSTALIETVYDNDTILSSESGTFSADLSGLDDNTTYYYQAVMTLADGSDVEGAVVSFKTKEASETPPAGDQPGWAELPVMNIAASGRYMINSTDDSQYYAWHISPDVYYGGTNRLARNYTVCYSATHHCPVWVAAPRHSMYVGKSGRTDAYGKDPDIPANIQYSSKDTGGGCNKGHMLGSAERTCSVQTNRQVFYYTNIAPQLSSGFNTGGGGWNTLEDYVDSQVCSDTLYIVIGCYFDKYTDGYDYTVSPKTISFGGRNDVHMPTMFYYALLRTKSGNSGKYVADCTADDLKCVAFVRSHTNSLKGQKVTARELMSISDLEQITGVEYFPNVPNAPKDTYKASDWGL